MDARFYNTEEIDLERLAVDIVNVYQAQGYQAQQFGNRDQMLVQLKKGGDFEALLGMQAAISLNLQHTAGGTLAMIGQQRWLDKAAVGTIGIVAFPILWPLALTAGAGAVRQASLANQALNVVDSLVRQQRPNIQAGPIPVQVMPQIQWGQGQPQWGQGQLPYQQQTPYYVPSQAPQGALPAPTSLRCQYCNTPYEPGDTFCSGCGRSLTPPKVYCVNCNTELKPGVSFCPKCGSSTFQSFAAAQSRQAPAQPAAPAYTPPPAQAPTYTPPATPVYTPPPAARIVDAPVEPPRPAPQPAPPAPPQQEPYYVPPVTPQNPAVTPQPKVTFVPGTAQPETPPAAKPAKPETPYYVPSNQQAQQALDAATNVNNAPTIAAPAARESLRAQPSSQPAPDLSKGWGMLTFSNGKQQQLKGERAIVGRYDHDLGSGVQPDVDLSDMQGADTVSRIHAVLQHIGSAYLLTDLNSTNATRLNGKRLEPDKDTPLSNNDTITFGKVTCTFKTL